VTKNGNVFRSNGIVETVSDKTFAETAFGRKKVLNELLELFNTENKKLQSINDKINDTIDQINSIDIKYLSENLKLLTNDESNLEKQISQIQFEKNKAVEEIQKLNTEITNIKKINEDLENKKLVLQGDIDRIKTVIVKSEEELQKINTQLLESEKTYSDLITQENELKILLTRLQSEKNNHENLIEYSQNEISVLELSIRRNSDEIKNASIEIEELKQKLEKNSRFKSELEQKKARLNDELKIITSDYNAVRNQINEIETKLDDKRKSLEQINNEIHHREMTLNECKLKSESLIERIYEEYQLQLFERTFDDNDTFDFEGASKRVHELKNKIRSLGPINSLAFQEYEEEKKRLQFLQEQRNDLIESEKQLLQVIDEINTTAQQLFLDTFEKIRINFINTFRGLFNEGDEADLRLEENVDPLEAKIEILAKPKGKRPQSIDLLSG
ncbi:MAG: chromosome segregation protein SMC, partial [Ignavibacteria bacterium]|nr:chromosome segregation protein SMC [Ignavibacteria bacterium]